MDITIKECEHLTEAGYRDFLLRDKHHLLFAAPEWINLLQTYLKCQAHHFFAYSQGRLVGSLSVLLKKTEHGVVANSLPYYGCNGGCLVDPELEEGLEVKRALLQALFNRANTGDWYATTLISSPWDRNFSVYHEYHPAYQDSRIGQLTPMPSAEVGNLETSLMDLFHQKTRNMVRKSQKAGFSLTTEWTKDNLEFLSTTHQENMSAIGGLAKRREFFHQVEAHLPTAQRRLYVARLENQPVAALLLLYFNKTVEYFTPVIKAEYRPLQPLSFLIFAAMSDAARQGYQWWNWGGTWNTQQGVYLFKSRWGTLDLPYYYFTYAHREMEPLIKLGKQKLLEFYRHFYVLPFTALEEDKEEAAA